MSEEFNPFDQYNKTKKIAKYVALKDATQADYDRIGFKSGLEVHQQLLTRRKLFCHCPAGIYNAHEDYDAELVRHMRPTLSELGEYDGTALMEFKTRKEIIYRIKNETACTYEVDDTPPFPIDPEALDTAIEISLLSKLNIVGEVHITRKQYLDGSIPTGFQRTAIIGVEGEVAIRNKTIRLIQLSIEEDSCREISDIGHTRVYKTDRLGMPLIETVTYPDCINPEEVKETCDTIRFLNRSTGRVRTGMGAGRQDVNVSCRGGSRVEIKGVAHTKWIPALTHNEAFRQWCLLLIRDGLKERINNPSEWKVEHKSLDTNFVRKYLSESGVIHENHKCLLLNLPGFKGMLSHFTQPGKSFFDEFVNRLKVIACLEKPNSSCSEDLETVFDGRIWVDVKKEMPTGPDDAQIIIWGPEEDMTTALETIEERAKMAFEGVPPETRKSFADGTTIFERVLPGADRMYPDTDSAPIPLYDDRITELSKNLPSDIIYRYQKYRAWNIPEDTYSYLFSKNLYPIIERIVKETKISAAWLGSFLGHTLKHCEGRYGKSDKFTYKMIIALMKFLESKGLEPQIAKRMLPMLLQHPEMDFDSILNSLKFKRMRADELKSAVSFLEQKFETIRNKPGNNHKKNWVMGQLHYMALGNMPLGQLSNEISNLQA